MSQELQRAKDSFCIIAGHGRNGPNERRGIMIGPNKILTALHDLRQNEAFEIFLPEAYTPKISINAVKIDADEGLDAAVLTLRHSIAETWVQPAGRKYISPLETRRVITDVTGQIEDNGLTRNTKTSKALADIFYESDMPMNAADFEVLTTDAPLNSDHSGSPIVDKQGHVTAMVSGVIDGNKGLGSLIMRGLGGKTQDVFAARQNSLARFVNEHAL